MKFEIRHRWNNEVLFRLDTDSLKSCLAEAIKKKVNLRDSNLSGSDLSGSDLSDSNLSGSDLQPIRDDIWAVLSSAPAEVEGLRKALIEGRVDGSTYTGACACLVGTIANVRGCPPDKLPILKQNSNRPAERFFFAINKGDIPKTNQVSRLALEWVEQWISNVKGAFAEPVSK